MEDPLLGFQEIVNYGVGHPVPEESLCKKKGGTSQQFWVIKQRIAHGRLKFQTSFGLVVQFGENLRPLWSFLLLTHQKV
jgi:hypothetical protein